MSDEDLCSHPCFEVNLLKTVFGFQVVFAALIPASLAVSITFPFAMRPFLTSSMASCEMRMVPAAVACRAVASLSLTSTIRLRPAADKCVISLFRFATGSL